MVSAPACYGVESDEDDAYDNFSFDNFNENIESSEEDEVLFLGLLVPVVDVCPKCSPFFSFFSFPLISNFFLIEYSFFSPTTQKLKFKKIEKYKIIISASAKCTGDVLGVG